MGVLTGIALGAMIAGTVVKAKAQKKAATQAGDEAMRVGELNAKESELQAVDTSRRGLETQNMFRREGRVTLGAQRAGYAGQGVELGAGSDTPNAMTASSEALLQSDLHRISFNAQREAMGYTREAEEFRRSGRIAKSTARSQGKWAVAGTLLGGGADASLMASRMNWKGKPD